MELSKETLVWMYEHMQLIRVFENRVKVEFGKGKIPGFVHLYAGQEAIAVGICANLTDADYMTSTHRGHGHCIAKGVDPRGMMAELFGKATGTCKGKGGSMHIADIDKGMLGSVPRLIPVTRKAQCISCSIEEHFPARLLLFERLFLNAVSLC